MQEYKKADARHPMMGLNNKICKNPAYWCRLHEVFLSEEDVKRKQCMNKPTFDMIGTQKCGNIERREFKHNKKEVVLHDSFNKDKK